MKRITALFLFLILCIPCASEEVTAPEAYAAKTVKAFADSLFLEGFYDEAEGEYRRSLFLMPQGSFAEDAALKLAAIYRQTKNKSGIKWLNEGFSSTVSIQAKEKINLVHGGLLFLERDSADFHLLYNTLSPEFEKFSIDFTNLFEISDSILQNQLLQAAGTAKAAVEQNAVFQPLAASLAAYNTKSAGLALFLSAIIPGLGKGYGASWGAALTDFLTVGSFVAGTIVTGIQSSWMDWRPYVFGAAGLVLYAVNLYSAYQNVKRYNAAQYRLLCEEADKVYDKIF